METSDDAAVAKLSAVRKGYYRVPAPTPVPCPAHRPRPFCLFAHQAICTQAQDLECVILLERVRLSCLLTLIALLAAHLGRTSISSTLSRAQRTARHSSTVDTTHALPPSEK